MQAVLISSVKAPNAEKRASSVSTYPECFAQNASVSAAPAGFGTASLVIVLAIFLQLLGVFSLCHKIRAKPRKSCQHCLLPAVIIVASRLIND